MVDCFLQMRVKPSYGLFLTQEASSKDHMDELYRNLLMNRNDLFCLWKSFQLCNYLEVYFFFIQ